MSQTENVSVNIEVFNNTFELIAESMAKLEVITAKFYAAVYQIHRARVKAVRTQYRRKKKGRW